MTTLTINLSDDQSRKLQEMASRLGVTPEDLGQSGIAELLRQPDEAFRDALDYVLAKNAALYQRLA